MTGVPIGDLTAPDLTTSAEPSDNMLNRLLGEFEDVFSTDLGLIKGPPASLKLKETATPKFSGKEATPPGSWRWDCPVNVRACSSLADQKLRASSRATRAGARLAMM
ncbi:uncharacterized protein LOC144149758 [Haemaphysalis longicornis]